MLFTLTHGYASNRSKSERDVKKKKKKNIQVSTGLKPMSSEL